MLWGATRGGEWLTPAEAPAVFSDSGARPPQCGLPFVINHHGGMITVPPSQDGAHRLL
jgi:hypothetical protein